jgi:Ni,Fe-hydrogenase III large subunit
VSKLAVLRNGQAVGERAVPVLAIDELRSETIRLCKGGARLSALFGHALEGGARRLYVVIAEDWEGRLLVGSADLAAGALRYRALTPDLPEAHWFERELLEEEGVVPEGHPWPKPIRREQGYPFYRVEGEEVHEVHVGPVHAGIIEPGSFRFQCHGEEVIHLEIHLGYQRRGAEKILERPGLKPARAGLVAETIAGDSSIAHATAHAAANEALASIEAPPRAQVIRAVALELERLANHVGDLAGLSTDIAFLPGAAYFGRARGEFLNLGQEVCGNRYGRSLVRPGGLLQEVGSDLLAKVRDRVARARDDLVPLLDLFFGSPSVLARLDRTGTIGREAADDLGLVGPPARAAGCDRDARRDHAAGAWRFTHIPVAIADSGDVHARALVRRVECERSLEYLLSVLDHVPQGPIRRPMPARAPSSIAVALVEGWRGETVHAIVTRADGEVARYKVVDPSFHNWFGLAFALRGQQISDFPLCNKSFNLSYAGHDL